MSRAEQRALEAYPPKMRYVGIDSVKDDRKIDVNKPMRDRYIKAYHQAEKDSELTWEDIVEIETLLNLVRSSAQHKNGYKEVLKRFKDFKERKDEYGRNLEKNRRL